MSLLPLSSPSLSIPLSFSFFLPIPLSPLPSVFIPLFLCLSLQSKPLFQQLSLKENSLPLRFPRADTKEGENTHTCDAVIVCD